MVTDIAAVRNYFAKLGLEPEIADIYLALHSHGPQTISELSRNARVERTRIYRLIDTLLESNLIQVETHYKRGIIKAAPIANINILINEKEQELKSLKDGLGLIEQALARNSLSSPATRAQFYHGPEGIRQMQWNLFRAENEILSIMHRPMYNITGTAFFQRWAERYNSSEINTRLICNAEFISSTNEWHQKHPGYAVRGHYSRALPPSVMDITFCVDTYNDTVAYYNWLGDEVFGIEIYNQDIANAQRVFFDMLWAQTTPIKTDLGRLNADQSVPIQ